jgi:hypothetical protein
MSYLVWWPLLKHLRNYARLQPELTGVDVRAGMKQRPKDPYPCVELVWDAEDAQNLYRTNKGAFTVWVDCWIRNNDKDPSAGYDTLHVLQENISTVIVRWSDAVLEDLNFFVNLELHGIVSDGDNNRPLCGSRMILKMNWRRSD